MTMTNGADYGAAELEPEPTSPSRMSMPRKGWLRTPSSTTLVVAAGVVSAMSGPPTLAQQTDGAFRFRTGIELVNVTATVTDSRGRFVSGLEKEDFLVYEDDELQEVTHFSNERVPVSLGIVLDTSGSMDGAKMDAAREAIDRFLFDLLGPEDEIFIYRFSYQPQLVHDWTSDRDSLSRSLRQIRPRGGTALLDAVADAVQMATGGTHNKKAVVVISDGNDTNSETDERAVQQLIRESEVLVYAIGIDGRGGSGVTIGRPPSRPPIPFPFPGGRRGRSPFPQPAPWPRGGGRPASNDERVNVSALRDLTDDSGGRTELVRDAGDLEPATASVADELSKQYYLAYPSPGHDDGEWHSIDVEVRNARHRVRARRGYVATP
jgi:VWFA-related protein